MTFQNIKTHNDNNDFKQRVENAIRQLNGVKLVGADNETYTFDRDYILQHFEIDDMRQYNSRNGQVYTDGSFILYAREQILLV